MIEVNSATLSPYQQLCDLLSHQGDGVPLTTAQKCHVLQVLKEVDLTNRYARKLFIKEIKTNSDLTLLVHRTLTSTQEKKVLPDEIGDVDFDDRNFNDLCIELDHELNEALFDLLIEAVESKGAELNLWLSKYGEYFDEQMMNSLEEDENKQFWLATLLADESVQRHPECIRLTNALPELGRNYHNRLQSVDPISGLAQDIKSGYPCSFSALAHHIACNRIALAHLQNPAYQYLDNNQMLALAPYLQYGNFNNLDDRLTQKIIPLAPQLKTLIIQGSSIQKLPASMPNLVELDCSFCYLLETLPENMAKVRALKCSSTKVKGLPESLPNLETLECQNTYTMDILPGSLPKLRYLDCSSCLVIAQLPLVLPAVEELICDGCTYLSKLSSLMPALRRLKCSNCPNIRGVMPFMVNCNDIEAEGSPLNFTKMAVDLQEVAMYPRKTLVLLGERILFKDKPFPELVVYENGSKTPAYDTGGVSRDFISGLMESLFNQNLTSYNALPLDKEGFPTIDDGKDLETAYATLGLIMCICHQNSMSNPNLKTGELFEEEVYRRITCMPGEDLSALSDESMVNLYQKYMDFPSELAEAINFPEKNINLDDMSLNYLRACVDLIEGEGFSAVDSGAITQAFLNSPHCRKELTQAIRREVLQNKQIIAVNSIAKGFRKKMTALSWINFCRLKPSTLHDSIEGTLSKDLLLKKIIWKNEKDIDPAQFDKVKEHFTDWLERANLTMVRKLVRVISGNNTLGKRDLFFEVYDRDAKIIPSARTCFNSLELSCNYASQELFDGKLELLINEGLAGSGFQDK